MSLINWLKGDSCIREFQRVCHEDGSVGPVYVCEKYFDFSGKFISEGYGGKLSSREKKICEKNPELVCESPFSYAPREVLE